MPSAPRSHVIEKYDPYRPNFDEELYDFYLQLRHEAPVYHAERFGVWLVSRYEDILTVTRNPTIFSSAENTNIPFPLPPEVQEVLKGRWPLAPGAFNNDPPGHTRARALLRDLFSAARIARLEPGIRERANHLIDGFAQDGQVELRKQFALPLPMSVILYMLGLPGEDIPRLRQWCDGWMGLFNPMLKLEEQVECARGIVALQQYFEAQIAEHRAHPRDDFLTEFIQARAEGVEPLSLAELVSHMMVLLVAGHETTTNLLCNMLLLLSRYPEQRQAILEDPSLWAPAIEEALRLESPIQMEPRVVTEDFMLNGVTLPKGARVNVLYGAANRDETVFPAPERFDLKRPNLSRHFGFGWGPHFCIGASLARLEARIAFELLHERLPGLRFAPGHPPEYVPNFFFRMLKQVPLIWEMRA